MFTNLKYNIMRTPNSLILLIFSFIWLATTAQENKEIEISSDVKEVMVYLEGAQITRTKTLEVPLGKSVLKFIGLSPFIDAKSITSKAEGELTILSVNYRQNYLKQQETSIEENELNNKKKNLEKEIDLEKTYIEVLKEELNFLKTNSKIGGENTTTSVSSIKETSDYYSNRILDIKLKEIDHNNKINEFTEKLNNINNQIRGQNERKKYSSGEILINIDSKTNAKTKFEIKYLVKNAGWYPSYDIRVESIDQPSYLIYKANIHQNTYEDWKNVSLKLSSGDPKASSKFTELKTYFLNYNTTPPSYKSDITQVSGYVYENDTNSPLPGVTVTIKGSSIGTVTDMNGYYSISVPPGGGTLSYSFVGMKQQEKQINNSQINIVLEPDLMALDEVVVVGYGVEGELQGRVAGVNLDKSKNPVKERGVTSQNSIPVQMEKIENQTNVEFDIKIPYTIPSDGKNYTIDIDNYSIPTKYQYYSTPKVEKSAFLLAEIVNWEQYNLLEGEANIFFEGTYTGKTLIDTRYLSDTLSISLGKDKSVAIDRQIQKQFTTKRFLGSKKEEIKTWTLTVKNNKQQSINFIVYDQIPVSTLEEIEVEAQNLSDGQLEHETGKVKWMFMLNASDKKIFELRYSVKYPKSRSLVIE
jgi:hypothetical protein